MARDDWYQIQMQGWLDKRWTRWFEGMTMTFGHTDDGTPVTTLTSAVDQAALRGILSRIWDLNLTLLSVTRCDAEGDGSNE